MNRKQIKQTIIFEDNYLLVMNKPAGLLSIPDRSGNPYNAFELLCKVYGELYVVHRIDKGTSGILIFAKDESTHRALNELFENRKIDKTYLTIVEGVPVPSEGRIDLGIGKDPTSAFKMKILKSGKTALSKYKLIEDLNIASIVEIKLMTERTHQIRLHMNAIGHPLLIDNIYGRKEEFYLSEIKRKKFTLKKDTEERPLIDRLTLHAYKMGFKHPVTNKGLLLKAPLPKDLKALVNQLRKWCN